MAKRWTDHQCWTPPLKYQKITQTWPTIVASQAAWCRMENRLKSQNGEKMAKKKKMALGPKRGKHSRKMAKQLTNGPKTDLFATFGPFSLFLANFFPFLDFGPFSFLYQAAWLAKQFAQKWPEIGQNHLLSAPK